MAAQERLALDVTQSEAFKLLTEKNSGETQLVINCELAQNVE